MPAPFAIPGYYWDEQLQKFFKIETTGTAPAGAFWSRENVDHVERRQQQRQQWQDRRDRQQRLGRRRRGRSERGMTNAPVEEEEDNKKKKKWRRRRQRPASDDEDDDEYDDDGDNDNNDEARPRRVQRSGLDDDTLFACAAGGWSAASGGATVSDGRRFGVSPAAVAAAVLARSLTRAGAAVVLEEEEEIGEDERWWQEAEGAGVVFRQALRRPQRVAEQTTVSCLYVHGGDGGCGGDGGDDDAYRLGILYTNYTTSTNGGDVKGQYIATDENGCIPSSWPTKGRFAAYADLARTRAEGLQVPDVSAIAYHAPSHKLIVASRQLAWPDGACISIYTPHDVPEHERPAFPAVPWAVGQAHKTVSGQDPSVVQIWGSSEADAAYACAVAPASASGTLCVVGTGRGLAVVDQEALTLQHSEASGSRGGGRPRPVFEGNRRRAVFFVAATRRKLGLFRLHQQPQPGLPPPHDSTPGPRRRPGRQPAGSTAADPARSLVTSVDYLDSHPQLVVVGTRCPEPWLVDLREPAASRWHRFGGGGGGSYSADSNSNAVAHVRSVGSHRVVAAGLRNTMLLYDVRYMKPQDRGASAGAALLRFADYHNEARLIGLGFAADAGLGLVAVGEEHAAHTRLGGGVSVYALATGARLSAPGLVGADTGAGAGIGHAAQTIVQAYDPLASSANRASPPPSPLPRIQALSFASLPGDGPSLFAGVGPYVHKYAVGAVGEDVF